MRSWLCDKRVTFQVDEKLWSKFDFHSQLAEKYVEDGINKS